MIVESFILGFREEYGSWNTMFTSRRTARSSDVDRRRSENRSAMASTRSVAPAARACSYSASSESGTSKRTSPSVGFSSRMRQRPTVPLPDPVPPSRPQTCSFWIFRPTSATAFSEVVARNAPRTGKNLLSPYAAIIMLLPLVEPAGDQLIIPLPEVDRHDTVALFKSEGTSGVEGAPRRRGAPYTPDVPSLLKDRKSTRLNSSPSQTSYAVFCLKKKKEYRNVRHVLHRRHENGLAVSAAVGIRIDFMDQGLDEPMMRRVSSSSTVTWSIVYA